ncbi:hypothetical protein [Streptomyces xanthii]|uniref:Uncharacterized protein n=1 Tax=Streptomyces xanthii TaxID=2768069 RepID=A0A7H1B2V3_9ACTN|nr:hypothetical protein [Streptomyces xanthii]QNS03058.1 hypothetical protein IAG42_05080 [Streptomyces xanthii]
MRTIVRLAVYERTPPAVGLDCLRSERRAYAWVMRLHRGLPRAAAGT